MILLLQFSEFLILAEQKEKVFGARAPPTERGRVADFTDILPNSTPEYLV